MQSKKDKALEALKKIILHDDQLKLKQLEQELSSVKQQIADKESLIASLDPIIADLLQRKISDSREEMAETLAPIMGDAIKHQIAEAKDDVVDALYPIIGKTIRKSVAEAMKKLVETVNQKIDRALRQNLFKKFLQSKITGVPEGELVLKDAMPFQIEEIFLIHKDSGLLLSHFSAKGTGVKVDEELISGMLTAIRNFVSEAFTSAEEQELDEIQYGSSKILLDMGHYSYLAIVISGVEPTQFIDDVHNLSRKIHNRYYKPLRQFDGDITQFGEMPRLLKTFTRKYDTKQDVKKPQKSRPYLLYILIGLLLIFLIVFALKKIPGYFASRKIQSKIEKTTESIPILSSQDVINQIYQRISQVEDFQNLAPKLIVDNNQVTIEGKVPSIEIKRKLGYLVSEISSVRVVINNLEVQDDQQVLFEHAKSFLDSCMIYFDVDGETIPQKEYQKLTEVVNCVRGLNNIKLVIKGYSDNLADSVYNLRLSEHRARSVSNYLTSRGFPGDNIVVESHGEQSAIASNETDEGRAKNRRVEFDIIRKR
jgi:outer membrane protein OmpA-like peptidoglycan-associated protein